MRMKEKPKFLAKAASKCSSASGRMSDFYPVHALDHTPFGDWTLAFQRDSLGRVAGITIGCWRARGIRYRRVA
jgi:hypothetical protein